MDPPRPSVDLPPHADDGTWQPGPISPDLPIQPPRRRPGAITPLGIRHDKSRGPLGMASASNTIAEMDSALCRLQSWQQRHEQQMASLRQKEMAEFQELYMWRERREAEQQAEASDNAALEEPAADKREEYRPAERDGAGPRAVCACRQERPGTAAPSSFQRLSTPTALPVRPGTALPLRPPTAASKSRALIPQEMDLLRHSIHMTFDRHRPRPATAPSQPDPSTRRGDYSATPSTRGDELLAELEAELAELDEQLEGSEVVAWESDLQDVLAKMDALQTGYQAGLPALSRPPRPASAQPRSSTQPR